MPEEVIDPAATVDDDAGIAAEVAELTASPSDQQTAKVTAALIAAKKGEKAARKRIAELEPVANRVTEVQGQLDRVQPIIMAVTTNPKLLAEANRIAQGGTRPTSESTAQPDDEEASAFAENVFSFYMADGTTPDVARARRAMDLMDRRNGRQTNEILRPYAGVTLGQKADTNISAAIAQTDDDGIPLATEESIREVVAQFGPQGASMLADPKIVNVVLESAIGRDKIKKRTPKAAADPLYLAQTSGRRSAPAYSQEERRAFAAVGLTEADLKKTNDKLESAGGRAINLGGNR